MSSKNIKGFSKKYGVRPSRGLGQHFLVDKRALAKVVAAAQITKSDVILEIGPGTGLLTQELAQRTGKVIAIEKDQAMVDILGKTLQSYKNIEIIHGDILKLEPESYKLEAKSYKVVANIPYYITSPLIRMFLEAKNPPEEMVLMVQKEVAQRICAKAPDMNLLAVSVQFYAKPEIISYVSKGCFWPQPKIDSAIIKITPLKKDPRRPTSADFFRIVKAGFSHPRKQLAGNLSKTLKVDKMGINSWLLKNNIQPSQRAETLTVAQWEGLARTFYFFNQRTSL